MKRALVLLGSFAVAGCGISSSELDERLSKEKLDSSAYADLKSSEAAVTLKKDIDEHLGVRVRELESSGAPRNWVTEQVNAAKLKTLDEVDKKLALMEGQLADVKKKVDVVNMANKEEVMQVLTELQGMTVTLVQQLKTQRDALEQSIKQLEAIQVPDLPKK